MTSRRGFLGIFTSAVATAVLDPELALWKPGKLISVPNRVLTPLPERWMRMRVIQHYDPIRDLMIARLDWAYTLPFEVKSDFTTQVAP